LTQPKQSEKHDDNWVVWEGTDNEGNYGKMTLLGGSYDAETRLDKFVRRFELTLANGEQIVQDIDSEKHFASLEHLRDWLHDAGFIIGLQCEDYDKNPINEKSCEVKIYARKKSEKPTKLGYRKIDNSMLYDIGCAFDEGSKKWIILNDDAFALAALDENIPVGFISVTPRAMDYPLEHIKDAYIEIYEVHDFYQRKGIGRHLVQCAEEWAREQGYCQIRTHHNDKAVAAIHMSYSLGYGMSPYEYHKDEGCAGYYVAKVLNSR
jgi:GNAT superfamily N-acetyltransferase